MNQISKSYQGDETMKTAVDAHTMLLSVLMAGAVLLAALLSLTGCTNRALASGETTHATVVETTIQRHPAILPTDAILEDAAEWPIQTETFTTF